MTFTHLGRKGYSITLWAATASGQKNWLEKIEQRQNILRERSMVFDTALLSEGYFVGSNRATCAAPFGASLDLSLRIKAELHQIPATASSLARNTGSSSAIFATAREYR